MPQGASIPSREVPARRLLLAAVDHNGGVVSGAGTLFFQDVAITIPDHAFSLPTQLEIEVSSEPFAVADEPVRLATRYSIRTTQASAKPVQLSLPTGAEVTDDFEGDPDEVHIWIQTNESWQAQRPVASSSGVAIIRSDLPATIVIR